MSGPIRGFAIALPGLNFYGSSFRFRLVLPLVSDDLQLSLELLASKDDGAAEIKQEDYKRSKSSLSRPLVVDAINNLYNMEV